MFEKMQVIDTHVYVCTHCGKTFRDDKTPCDCAKDPLKDLEELIILLKHENQKLREFLGEENYLHAMKGWKHNGI